MFCDRLAFGHKYLLDEESIKEGWSMSRILILSFVIALLAGCASPVEIPESIRGSGTLVSRTYDLKDFSQIYADVVAQVEVTRGDAYSVRVEVDDNVASRLEVSVTGDTLRIDMEDGAYNHVTLRAQVTMPKLTGVTLDGASTLQGELAGEDLDVDLDGASQATLTGTAGRVKIEINGGSRALLGDLAAQDVELNANGGSHVEVNASGTVSGQANGGSQIIVTGSPTSVNVKTEGGSQVTTK
jgi:hypothetical protein